MLADLAKAILGDGYIEATQVERVQGWKQKDITWAVVGTRKVFYCAIGHGNNSLRQAMDCKRCHQLNMDRKNLIKQIDAFNRRLNTAKRKWERKKAKTSPAS